jgi:hypothetical protein
LETNNYTTLIGLVQRVPRIETLRDESKGWKGTPLGELEDITEIAPFEAKVVKEPETETDYTTYALIAAAATGLYVATR